jgi:hypothetical protein
VLFHGEAADRTADVTVPVLKMRAWPSGSEELVLDLECEVPDPALDFDEVLVGGDGTVDPSYAVEKSKPVIVSVVFGSAEPGDLDGPC